MALLTTLGAAAGIRKNPDFTKPFIIAWKPRFETRRNQISLSSDCITWADIPIALDLGGVATEFDGYVADIKYANGLYVCVYAAAATAQVGVVQPWYVLTSTDAIRWSNGGAASNILNNASGGVECRIAFGNGIWVAVINAYDTTTTTFRAYFYYSYDGKDWITNGTISGNGRLLLAYGIGTFVLSLGHTDKVYTSTDGLTFTARTLPAGISGASDGSRQNIIYGNGVFVMLVSTSSPVAFARVLRSADGGITWTFSTTVISDLESVVFSNGFFTGFDTFSAAINPVKQSADGDTWASYPANPDLGFGVFFIRVMNVNQAYAAFGYVSSAASVSSPKINPFTPGMNLAWENVGGHFYNGANRLSYVYDWTLVPGPTTFYPLRNTATDPTSEVWRARNLGYTFTPNVGIRTVSPITDATSMFESATGTSTFNDSDIQFWDTSTFTNMTNMFYTCNTFNQPLNSWDVSNVTNMGGMFAECNTFNQPLNNWNTSKVTNMSFMFFFGGGFGPSQFNQPLSNWDTSSVTDMAYMFCRNVNFNQDISAWDVSNVTIMEGMFYGTFRFNCGQASGGAHTLMQRTATGGWRVGAVTNMTDMFRSSSAFNGDISNWCVTNIPSAPTNFATGANASFTVARRPTWGACPFPN